MSEATTQLVKKTFHVNGMTCSSCANSVETVSAAQQGVANATVNYATSTLFVEFDPGLASFKSINSAVKKAGYNLVENVSERKENTSLKEVLVAVVFSLLIMALSMGWVKVPYANIFTFILTSIVLFYSGSRFFVSAFRQLLMWRSNMDTLIAIGSGTAFIYSTVVLLISTISGEAPIGHYYFDSAAMIITFILIGKYLEERAKNKTGEAIESLIKMQPQTALRLKDNSEEEIPVKEVLAGDILLIRSGEKIPLDGKIISGHSFVDESMISGEMIPVEKFADQSVFAGTINKTGSFKMEVEKVSEETLLAQIIQLVRQAQGSKAPVQALTDKISSIFVPTVIVISMITLLFWWFVYADGTFTFAIIPAISVLIIACPCALGLATPTAIIAGIGKGAKMGVLFKNAEGLQNLGEINVLVTDKTGTITNGEPEVFEFIWENDISNKSLILDLLNIVEKKSDHPLAYAVCNYIDKPFDQALENELKHFEIVLARGLRCEYNGKLFLVGNNKLIEEEDIVVSKYIMEKAHDLNAEGKTIIYVAFEGIVVAVIGIFDDIKEGADEALNKMRRLGLDVIMMTGDSLQAAEPICQQLGIKKLFYDVKPQQKQQKVKELQEKGFNVAMTGDGINDAPALSQANVGIAIGTGTDVAMQSGSVILINGDLRKISQAIDLSKSTLATIRRNLVLAFLYNIICIPIAAGFFYAITNSFLNPMIAAAAMALSSLSVVFSSLWLYYKKIE